MDIKKRDMYKYAYECWQCIYAKIRSYLPEISLFTTGAQGRFILNGTFVWSGKTFPITSYFNNIRLQMMPIFLVSFSHEFLAHKETGRDPSLDSSIGSASAWYWGGPGFESRQSSE